ncbi:MAG: DUF1579 family protein [Deferribacteres bacterium]|nr:DUF1579 family protein [candidate division KSB1 bacterium]MCB9503587.1 DUF1579 family protein [Deferribacteres bacterium]
MLPYFLFTLLFCTLVVQNPASPCQSEEAMQFDFWVGKWQLTWPGGQGGTSKEQFGTGTNEITKILGSCVVRENFASPQTQFNGESYSVYNPAKKVWQQTWIDNSGAYLLFEGEFAEGKMILRTKPVETNGKTIVSRMVFENITQDSLDWNWQRSVDGGINWTDLWTIHYKRIE